jgi:hypothetical protein
MTLVLWRALDEPRVPNNLRWGFRAANLALTCEPISSSVYFLL